jgi:hypothetical protein
LFPENSIWNTAVPLLSYSCMFQVEICSQQLEVCKSVCMFIVLAIVVATCVPHKNNCKKKSWFTRHETDRFLNNHCQGMCACLPRNPWLFIFSSRGPCTPLRPKWSPGPSP